MEKPTRLKQERDAIIKELDEFEEEGHATALMNRCFFDKNSPFVWRNRKLKIPRLQRFQRGYRNFVLEYYISISVVDIMLEDCPLITIVPLWANHTIEIDKELFNCDFQMPEIALGDWWDKEIGRENITFEEYFVKYHQSIFAFFTTQMEYGYIDRINPKKSKIDYDIYLNSDEWKELRKECFERDDFRCVRCGSAKNLNAHHLSYDHLGEHELDDLITLCGRCHTAVHKTDIERKVKK